MTTKNTGLISKIAQASLQVVGQLQADKRNTHQKYEYISADAVLQYGGKALADVGVVVLPTINLEHTELIEYTDNYNKTKRRYDSLVEFVFFVSDGTDERTMSWIGRGNDTAAPDKAMYKAVTSGHKYFLMKLLNIGVGNEDGEHEEVEPVATQPKPKKAAPKPKKPAPPVGPDSLDDVPPVSFDDGQEWPNEKHETVTSWNGPEDAMSWAIGIGACDNEYNARAALKHHVDDHPTGKLTPATAKAIFGAFYDNRLQKLADAQPQLA